MPRDGHIRRDDSPFSPWCSCLCLKCVCWLSPGHTQYSSPYCAYFPPISKVSLQESEDFERTIGSAKCVNFYGWSLRSA